MPPIAVDMLGTSMATAATTTDAENISAHPEIGTLVCMTAGIVVSSATIVTVPLVSQVPLIAVEEGLRTGVVEGQRTIVEEESRTIARIELTTIVVAE
jgi:hypothetical protein